MGEQLQARFQGMVCPQANSDNQLSIQISLGVLKGAKLRNYDSVVLQRLSTELPSCEQYKPEIWPNLINRDKIELVLKGDVAPAYAAAFPVDEILVGFERTGMGVGGVAVK